MIAVGQRIGNYEVISALQSGGMATLFLGRRVGVAGFSRHVALKVIHPELARDRSFVEMFLDEAMLSVRIHHPNVVHVEELGESNGAYFLAMEYVHGCGLGEFIRSLLARGARIPVDLAVWIAMQAADGIHAAHETRGEDGSLLNVIHRDVSPQNILLGFNGHVKVIDFGIAKAANRVQKATMNAVKGKLGYLAPEQAANRPLDRRVDVYALGIVLWEMLAMRRLVRGDNDGEMFAFVRDPKVEAPSTHNPFVSPALDAVVLRALAKDRDERPATAQLWRRMLVEALPAAATHDGAALAQVLADAMPERAKRPTFETASARVDAAPKPSPGDGAIAVAATTVDARVFVHADAEPLDSTVVSVGRRSTGEPRVHSAEVALLAAGPVRPSAPTVFVATDYTDAPVVPMRRGPGVFVLAAVVVAIGLGAAVWARPRSAPALAAVRRAAPETLRAQARVAVPAVATIPSEPVHIDPVVRSAPADVDAAATTPSVIATPATVDATATAVQTTSPVSAPVHHHSHASHADAGAQSGPVIVTSPGF